MRNYSDIDLNGVKAVLFDLDDTLYAYEPSQKKGFNACVSLAFKKYAISEGDFERTWKLAREKVHADLHGQGSSHSRLLYFQKQYEFIFNKSNPTYALEMEELFWSEFISIMKLDPEAKIFLEVLKQKNIKTCIVTDLTTQIQMKKWIHLGLGNYFDFLVSSEEAGVEKPSSEIFNLALEKLHVNATDAIMIGDNEKKDIAGASALGIKSYLIQANNN
ncbi:HAD family hydrolase [Aurantibacillus circumpalustris]|uniref:HAD family hydrolase n=1 Tax=Aurantibacillus circumpalustris TaxID=3036359 RepID=UPI00295B58E4|nr:HAD family hydrolase [Aurantibacillus circumpalustris]